MQVARFARKVGILWVLIATISIDFLVFIRINTSLVTHVGEVCQSIFWAGIASFWKNVPTGYDNLCFTDTIYFHADSSICSNGIAANRNQLLVDSIASQRHASSVDCVKPYRNTELTSTYAVFPRLQPRRDTIFVSTDYKVLRIRDFDFTISRCAKYPDGSALREPNVKFQPLENMRPQRYRAFLEELRQENRSPDDYLLEFIDKYYDWGNENGKRWDNCFFCAQPWLLAMVTYHTEVSFLICKKWYLAKCVLCPALCLCLKKVDS